MLGFAICVSNDTGYGSDGSHRTDYSGVLALALVFVEQKGIDLQLLKGVFQCQECREFLFSPCFAVGDDVIKGMEDTHDLDGARDRHLRERG